jgi:hypothetical protein
LCKPVDAEFRVDTPFYIVRDVHDSTRVTAILRSPDILIAHTCLYTETRVWY